MKITSYTKPKFKPELNELVDYLALHGIPQEAHCIYTGRNNVYTLVCDNKILSIKDFKKPKFPNCYIYTNFRKSKARRSFEHAETLLAKGIPTPEPLGWIEITENLKLTRSYYICAQSSKTRNLRNWENWDKATQDVVLKAYAELMHKMHNQGILHLDLSPGNVLWDNNKTTSEVEFDVIDLNRMTIKKRPLKLSEALSNFKNINLIEDETHKLAYLYGIVGGYPADKVATAGVERLLNFKKRKKRLKRLKNLFR